MATTYNAGIVTAYGAAVRGGYTGTYEEFCAQQANYAQNAAAVEQAKEDVQVAVQAAEKMIAEDYDETATYHIGDLVIYDGKLLRCNAEITTPEAYNRSHWTYFTVEDAIDNLEQGNVFTTCRTAEDDLNKTAMLYNYGITNYALKKFGLVAIRFSNAVRANSTLNINDTGAREIYKGNAPITDGVIKAGDTALFMLNGVGRFVFLGVDTYGDKIDSLTNDVYNTLVTDTASGSIASFPDGADDILVKSLTVDIEPVQSGSGDPSPTNVRPISGHTSAVVTVSPTTDAQDGTSYTIDLDGTRYGGSLDVGTGVLTVDMAIATLSSDDINTLTVEDTAGGKKRLMIPKTFFSGILLGNPSGTVANISCNQFVAKTANQTYSRSIGISLNAAGQIHIYGGDDIQTVSAFANIAPIQIVYPLATPFTVQLTAHDDITTVLGQNNIWSDTGDVEVTYRADTKLYIEKLTAPTEDDMIADHAISANTFFMIGNTLYRATTAIASGATITVGTNATKLSLSDALNALA